MTLEEVTKHFIKYPGNLDTGAGKLSRIYKCEIDTIYEGKRIARNKIKYGTEYHPRDVAFRKLPKVLIFDLEISPTLAYVWGLWDQNIAPVQVVSDWTMLSWSAKWLFSDNTISDVISPDEVVLENDYRITKSLWELINKADIIIAHNARKFDVKKMNTKFLLHKLPPPSPYQVIDTLDVAKRQFGFLSNKLDSLAEYLGLAPKLATTFILWKKCMMGDLESLNYMRKYNEYDVELLEEVYLKLRHWIKSHPNIGLYVESDTMICASCGGDHLTSVGHYHTHTGKFETFRCNCGALNRVRKSSVKNTKLVGIAR
jgi:hypothetical protein